MTNQTLDLLTEYNAKALETLRALGDLNVNTAEWFINKQVELTNSLMEASLLTSKQISAAKTPADALEASGKLVQSIADTMTGYVKDSAANATQTREEMKAVMDDAVKLNTEYANKAFESGVEVAKKTAKKAAA